MAKWKNVASATLMLLVYQQAPSGWSHCASAIRLCLRKLLRNMKTNRVTMPVENRYAEGMYLPASPWKNDSHHIQCPRQQQRRQQCVYEATNSLNQGNHQEENQHLCCTMQLLPLLCIPPFLAYTPWAAVAMQRPDAANFGFQRHFA